MQLHYNPGSPFVRLVCAIAHECGVWDEIKALPTGPLSPVVQHDALSSANPLGRIPALVTDDGSTIYDSRVICRYLAERTGRQDLFPPDPTFRDETRMALAQGIMDTAVNLRYEVAARPEDKRWEAWITRQRDRMIAACDELEACADELEPLSASTVAVACALGYLDFRHDDLEWRDGRPLLTAFFTRLSTRPSMVATRPPR